MTAVLMGTDALHLCRPLRGVFGQHVELDTFVRRRRRMPVFRRLLGGDSDLGLDFGGRAYLRVVYVGCLWRRWRWRWWRSECVWGWRAVWRWGGDWGLSALEGSGIFRDAAASAELFARV